MLSSGRRRTAERGNIPAPPAPRPLAARRTYFSRPVRRPFHVGRAPAPRGSLLLLAFGSCSAAPAPARPPHATRAHSNSSPSSSPASRLRLASPSASAQGAGRGTCADARRPVRGGSTALSLLHWPVRCKRAFCCLCGAKPPAGPASHSPRRRPGVTRATRGGGAGTEVNREQVYVLLTCECACVCAAVRWPSGRRGN